ncbi:serine kinase/phosphatase (plasmid) [Ralstonia sp. 25C]|uniref:serine kinase/phosphatase n=1 Tax=Ralstonia sp. 25C TaxID=3447363 RepID=UPI003F750E59
MSAITAAAGLGDAASRLSFNAQNEAITKEGEQDMLNAAKLQNELNRVNMFAKLMEAGPKAAKDLIS